MRSFASDNYAGVHPAVMQALADANTGHAKAYGADPWTAEADAMLRAAFGEDIVPYFVFLGTAANVLGIRSVARSFEAVLCPRTAHINRDECGAVEAVAGVKLLYVPDRDGKVAPEDLASFLQNAGNEHRVQPRVVSITQCTELGTLYTPEEVRALADFAHANGMVLHMDGARLGNAAAALGLSLKQITADCGVDILSFGGTKNGIMFGEAIVFFDPTLARDFKFLRKQGMQLVSKMRFIAAQFSALLTNDLWLESARNSNAMARLLAAKVSGLPGVAVTRPVETNVVFARLPRAVVPALQEAYPFYVWDEVDFEVRWMCSWDTCEADVDGFVAKLRSFL